MPSTVYPRLLGIAVACGATKARVPAKPQGRVFWLVKYASLSTSVYGQVTSTA